MKQLSEKTVDVDDILRGKMGPKAKYVPTGWLKRIVHQDEVNRFLARGVRTLPRHDTRD